MTNLYLNQLFKEITKENGELLCNYSYDKRQKLYICMIKDPKYPKGHKKFYSNSPQQLLNTLKQKL